LPDLFTRYDLPLTVEARADIEKALDEVLEFLEQDAKPTRLRQDRHGPCGYERTSESKLTLRIAKLAAWRGRWSKEAGRKTPKPIRGTTRSDAGQLRGSEGAYITAEEKSRDFQAYPAARSAEIEKRIRVPVRQQKKPRQQRPPPGTWSLRPAHAVFARSWPSQET